jgi:site-specific recombinase XerD
MKTNIALELFTEYLVNRNFSDNTVKKYYCIVRDFFLFCMKKDVRNIGKDDIVTYQKEIHQCGRYSKNTQSGIMHTLNHFFRFLTRHEAILINPFDSIDIQIIKREFKRDGIAKDKLCRILDSIESNKYLDLRDRAMFELMYGCGLRVGETSRLKMTDVDFQTGKVYIYKGKGKKDRVVPVGKNALRILKRYIEYGRSYLSDVIDREILFLSCTGRRLKIESINCALKKRAKKHYPDMKIYSHMLRHSFATHMLEAGAGIKQIKDILGHNSIETTVYYTHFNAKSMKKILKMYHPRENELYKEFERKKYENALKMI